MKWRCARMGEIEGTVLREDDEWIDIELAAPVRVTYARGISFAGHGRPYSHAAKGQVIKKRKSLLTVLDS